MIYNHAVTDGIKGESTLKQFLPQALERGGSEIFMLEAICYSVCHHGQSERGLLTALTFPHWVWNTYAGWAQAGGRRCLLFALGLLGGMYVPLSFPWV